MNAPADDAATLLQRLDAVEPRLAALAQTPPDAVGGRHTEPDPPTGETWEWGQVWAHLAEFIPYWLEQARMILDSHSAEPVPFGRTKKDAGRVAAIERDRAVAVVELWARVYRHIGQARTFIGEQHADAWSARGLHPTLGVMPLATLLDEFVVGHLEQHAAQLDGLVRPQA